MKPAISCTILLLGLISLSSKAQNKPGEDTAYHKRVHNVVPRVGIGASKHFITELGVAYVRSHFFYDKDLGLNAAVRVLYMGIETMTPYNKPMVYGYKAGVDLIGSGHVMCAMGMEVTYYNKDKNSGFAVIPKLGFPLIRGSFSYGIGIYSDAWMRKEIGLNRVSLTYSFDRKGSRVFSKMIQYHHTHHEQR